MKIGFLTLSPGYNYGGILQAFALQHTLKKIGHEPYMINRRAEKFSFFYFLKQKIKKVIFIATNNKTIVFTSQKRLDKGHEILTKYTGDFINTYITLQTKKIYYTSEFKDIESFDAYIVGSDQVWRPKYTQNIYDYYLDFVKNKKAIKIAYAASFGTDKWGYTKVQTEKCKKLVKEFNAVSVREDSGVELCQKYLGIKSKHVLDPTLLLTKEDYINTIDLSKAKKNNRGIMTYVLDIDLHKKKVIDEISRIKDMSVFDLALSTEDHNGNLLPTPPVEDWLQGFIDADYIITDSFHGTVFSIIFNKPFIAIGNESRGLSRFLSLLKMFKLENRLLLSINDFNKDLIYESINWEEVNNIIKLKQKEALDFLNTNLSK